MKLKKKIPMLLAVTFLMTSCGTESFSSNNYVQSSDSSSCDSDASSGISSESSSKDSKEGYTIYFDLDGGSSPSYVSQKNIESLSSDDFFFDCVKSGYNFRGWSYNGVQIFNEDGEKIEEVALEDNMTFKALYDTTAKLTIKTNMEGAGSLTGEGYYDYDSEIDVVAIANQGYDFAGWYSESGVILSNQEKYIYVIGNSDVVIEARFKLATFKLDVLSYDEAYGTVCVKDGSTTTTEEYKNQITEEFTYTDEITVSAHSKDDAVRFIGWYDDDSTLLSADVTYTFDMPNHDYKIIAKWNNFKISYELDGGTNNKNNPTIINTDEGYTLKNPSKIGYVFVGWYTDENFENEIDYIPAGTTNDLTLYAKWELREYYISYELYGGINDVTNPDTYTIETPTFSLMAPTKSGYAFMGWYKEPSFETQVETIAIGTHEDFTLYAKWEPITYTITYELDGGECDGNPESYNILSEDIVLSSPTKDGYTFLGWYSGNEKVTNIPSGSIGNISLTAKWQANKNVLTIISSDEAKGTVTISQGSGYTDEQITIKATPATDCVFEGWYRGNHLVSDSKEYTFVMPTTDYSLTGVFYTKEEKSRRVYGMTPVISEDGKTLTYGLYPQSRVSDSDTLSKLNALTETESNGWYLLDGTYYTKQVANPYSFTIGYETASTYFTDGEKIEKGTTYWFRCDLINWDIIYKDDGTYTLNSSVLLDTHVFYEDDGQNDGYNANNYAHSEIRRWLNDDFYNTAFLDNSFIQKTTVDNSAASAGYDSSAYASEDTYDNVYILSRSEYCNTEYGYDASGIIHGPEAETRECSPTDWARASHGMCMCQISDPGVGNGWYMSRSAYNGNSGDILYITDDGSFFMISSIATFLGVRPAIHIKIS